MAEFLCDKAEELKTTEFTIAESDGIRITVTASQGADGIYMFSARAPDGETLETMGASVDCGVAAAIMYDAWLGEEEEDDAAEFAATESDEDKQREEDEAYELYDSILMMFNDFLDTSIGVDPDEISEALGNDYIENLMLYVIDLVNKDLGFEDEAECTPAEGD